MIDQPVSDPAKPPKSPRVRHREARLKVALKANMAKRKAQMRGRAAAEGVAVDAEAQDNNEET